MPAIVGQHRPSMQAPRRIMLLAFAFVPGFKASGNLIDLLESNAKPQQSAATFPEFGWVMFQEGS